MRRRILVTISALPLIAGAFAAAAQTSPLGGTGSPSRLGQPGRTMGQPTTGMNAPAPRAGRSDQEESNRLPDVQRDRSNPLPAAPKQPEFQGSGGKAKDGSIPGGSLVVLTPGERQKIRDIIVSQTAAQEPRTNFKLMVGAKVPESVSLRPMPQEAVNVVPKYKDFDFTIVNDRIVVVQRSTREIDTIIPI